MRSVSRILNSEKGILTPQAHFWGNIKPPGAFAPDGLKGYTREISLPHTRGLDYSCGPAATSALPASLVVYLTKFLMKREARSLALLSHSVGSA